ncbi:WD repeat, SAM and U-box domain-containing protein 1-like [Limulus polyphemus]|uniref:WD repeat, SAM and U-box domain-containing protein 1 n=1 Tax=Limulus polyphemus TaxID=6850 RepID=A0ABM1T427_LIMPO|nr:WD repeat, SAM and U-box domain-containing protein 1-like [Limulus polyphemus]
MGSKIKASVFQILGGHTSDVTWCDFFGHTLVTGSNDKNVRLYEQDDQGKFIESSLSPLIGHTYGVNCVRFSPYGTLLASCSIDGTVILWNAQTGEQVAQLKHSEGNAAIRVCCFSPSSTLLASGGDDDVVYLWDIGTHSIIRQLMGHEAMITACAFTPDSSFLISGSSAGDLKLWDACFGHGKCLKTRPEAHDLGVLGCDISPNYQTNAGSDSLCNFYVVATCGNDDLVKLWHVRTGMHCSITYTMKLEGHSANVVLPFLSRWKPSGICVRGQNCNAVGTGFWSLDTEIRKTYTTISIKKYVTCCAFSLDTTLLATGSNDKTVILWSLGEQGPEAKSKKAGLKTQTIPSCSLSDQSVRSVVRWSVSEVSSWLERLDLKEHIDAFKKNNIDGQELLHLTQEGLQIFLKVESLGHRQKILRAIKALRNPLWQHQLSWQEHGDLPQEFFCPITHELMRDPVVAADGYSYEKAAIIEWLNSGKFTSPMSNNRLGHTYLTPNIALHLLIQKHLV